MSLQPVLPLLLLGGPAGSQLAAEGFVVLVSGSLVNHVLTNFTPAGDG
jgi:hypothetical protein